MDNLSPINSHTPTERTEFTAHMNHKIKELLKSHKLSVNGQSFASFTDKECSKLLMKARDFTSFESEHPSKITISDNLVNGERINHIESFVPVVPLSTQLKQTYFQDLKNQTWYKDLSPVDQAFTKAYSTKISDDKHIIPTQLQFLPGIHNFGLTSTFFAKDNVVDPNHQYDAMRSASPAYNIGKISKTDKTLMQAITEQNIKHIEDIAYLDKKAVAFRTVTNEIGGEKKMGKAVRATGALDVERTPLSITFSNKDKNLTEIWDKVAESAKKNTRTIVHFGCKSGKDRTGLVDKHNNLSAVKKYLESCGNTDGVKTAAYNVYNKAWHNEHLAGSYGGSLGSHGLKASTSYNLFFNPLSNANLLQQIKRLTATNKVSDLNLPKFMSKEDSNISDYDDKAPLIPFKKTSWLGKIFGKGKGNAR